MPSDEDRFIVKVCVVLRVQINENFEENLNSHFYVCFVHGLLAIGTCVFMLINKKDKFLIEIWTMRNSMNLYDIVQVYA